MLEEEIDPMEAAALILAAQERHDKALDANINGYGPSEFLEYSRAHSNLHNTVFNYATQVAKALLAIQ